VNGPDFIPVSVGTLKTLLMGRNIDFEKMPRVGLSGPMARESREILGCFVRHLIGREIKSLNVLAEIRKRYT
jgi:DNA repair protein RecO (recombination protein O)